jgi:O-antigen/teichoic acid export membrane protein
MSRVRRSTQTLATGLVSSAVVAVSSFATAPYLLDWLGAERFGAFRAAVGWFGFIGLLEFGVGGALQALFARALGTGERAGVVAAVRIGARAYLLVTGLATVAAAGLSIVLPGLIRLPASLNRELWIGCGLYLLTFAFGPLAPFRPLAEAGQRGYLVNLLLAAQTLGVAVAGVVFAYAGWGMIGQFAALVIGGVIFHVGLAWDGIRRYPDVLARGQDVAGLGRSLWALSWPTLLFNLSGRLGLLSDELVIAGLLGPAAVASFFLTQRVIVVAGSQVLAIGGATWAGLIDLHFRGEREVFVLRFTQLTRLTASLGAGLLLPVAVWNRDLIVLWVGSDRYAGGVVTWLAAANSWNLGLFSLWLWPLSAAGLVRVTLPAVICSATVNLGISLAATAMIGLPGPLIGTTAAHVGVTWWWTLLLLRRHLNIPPRLLLSAVAGPGILASFYGVGLVVLSEIIPAYDPRWPRWVCLLSVAGWLAGGAIGYLVLAWFLVLPAADRAEWVDRFRGWHRRRAEAPVGSGRD